MQNGHDVVVYDHDAKAVAALAGDGATGAAGLDKLVTALRRRARSGSCSRPAPSPTPLSPSAGFAAGDIIIDGGNTFWRDDIRRGQDLPKRGIHYVDVGTSGGVWGLERGYCMMIGGDKEIVRSRSIRFSTLAPGLGDDSAARRAARRRDPRAERRLHPCRPDRRRPFRQDGAQRHRIRPDAGLCGGLRHPARTPTSRALTGASASTSIWPTSPKSGGAAA